MNRKERRANAKLTRKGKSGSGAQMAEAIAFAQSGDFDKAEPILEAIRRADPDDPETKHQIGMIYVRTGRAEAGLSLLREAVDAKPGEALYWNNLAAAYLSLEMSQPAVEAARKAANLDPGYGTAWQNLAFSLRDSKDHAGAAEAFERASKLEELAPGSLASWGESLGNIGRTAEGETIVRRAVEKAPEDAAILTLLGWLLNEQRKSSEAIEIFSKSLELNPDQFLAAFNYGVLMLNRDSQTALRWLRRATSIDARNPAAWRVLAMELGRHGLKDEALPAAERAARLAPDDFQVAELLRKLKYGAETEIGPQDLVIEYDEPQKPAKPDFKSEDESGIVDLTTLRIG